jgi:hypothetical protein
MSKYIIAIALCATLAGVGPALAGTPGNGEPTSGDSSMSSSVNFGKPQVQTARGQQSSTLARRQPVENNNPAIQTPPPARH